MLFALILYVSGWTYSLTSTPKDRFLRNFLMAALFTLRVFARNLLRGNRRRNTFRIFIWRLAWGSNPGFSSNKPTHYILDHGDCMYTYVHNWPLQHLSQDYGLATHTAHVVCFNLYVSGGIYSLTSIPNNRFLGNFCLAGLVALRVFTRNLLRGSPRKNIFHFWWLTWDTNPDFCV